MPIMCPKCVSGLCDSICIDYGGDVCNYYHPPKPITQILTIEERLERLEQNPPPKTQVKYIRLREDVGMIEKHLMNYIDSKLKGKKGSIKVPF